jgi:hypothetical protein
MTTLNITAVQNTEIRTVSTSTMLRTVSLDTAMKKQGAAKSDAGDSAGGG